MRGAVYESQEHCWWETLVPIWTNNQTLWKLCRNLSFAILFLIGISCITMDTIHVTIVIVNETEPSLSPRTIKLSVVVHIWANFLSVIQVYNQLVFQLQWEYIHKLTLQVIPMSTRIVELLLCLSWFTLPM